MIASPGVPLILASASPRRSAFLRSLGLAHTVQAAHILEVPHAGESPEAYVERLAREKAGAVLALQDPGERAWVLAGDTTVALGDRILEKPRDAADAVDILMALSGREHRVASGLAVAGWGGAGPRPADAVTTPQGHWVASGVSVTRVRFRAFTAREAEGYVATGEPMDKAGAYGIQGLGGALVEGIEGEVTTVVGLPVLLLGRLLEPEAEPAGGGRG